MGQPKSKMREFFYRRTFLNRPRYHTGAHFLAYIKMDMAQKEKCLESSMTISDCSRQINLDFWAGTRGERKNALRKARLLAQAVTQFADALERAIEENWPDERGTT